MKTFFKTMLATMLIVSAVLFLGCSKDDDNGGESKGVVKLTITSSSSFNASNGNSITGGMSSSDASSNFLAIKINGEQTDASVVSHTRTGVDFNGGRTYVFETIGNYNTVVINVVGSCIDENPYTLTYKIEQGNDIIAENTLAISREGNAYNKNYIVQ